MTYALDEIIEAESADYATEAEFYKAVAHAFPLAPTGIEVQDYLRARSRASSILPWWMNEGVSTDQGSRQILAKIIADPVLKAIVIFELTNFLISSETREPFLIEFTPEFVASSFAIKFDLNKKEIRKISVLSGRARGDLEALRKSWRSIVRKDPKHIGSTCDFLDKVVSACRQLEAAHDAKTIRVLAHNSFQRKRLRKAHRHTAAIGLLALRLREPLRAAAGIRKEDTYQLLSNLVGSVTLNSSSGRDFSVSSSAIQKQADEAKNTFGYDLNETYRAIMERIPRDHIPRDDWKNTLRLLNSMLD